MNETIWTHEFTKWYIGGIEIILGVVWVVLATRLCDQARNFGQEMRDPEFGSRFRSVLERRRKIEKLGPWPWRIAGSVSLLLGILTVFEGVVPIVSYAVLCFTAALVMGVAFVRIRNRSERRAASLVPRSSTVISGWFFAATLLSVLAPLTFVGDSQFGVVAALISIVGVINIAVAAYAASNMAALLTGEDSEIEAIVDERIRRNRITALLILSQASSFVFMAIVHSDAQAGYQHLAYLVCQLSFVALMGLFAFSWFKRERPRGARFDVI